MDYYLKQFRNLLTKNQLDAIIIHASAFDDRYMKVLTGTYSILQNYLLLTKQNLYISEARYLIADLRKRTKVKLLSAEGEALIINEIIKKLGKGKKIGIVGDCKYRDLVKLEAKKLIDLTIDAQKIICYKSDSYINKLQKYAKKLAKIMDKIKITSGMNQQYISKMLHGMVIEANCDLAFPISITSGKDLFQSTTQLPLNKKIRKRDIVCIDMGLKKDIFTTDRTRMYFVNHPQAEKLYREIEKIHNEIIRKKVSPNIEFSDLLNEYKRQFNYFKPIKKILLTDFGHGIGFALHETPYVEKAKGKIGTNIVFTLEPTFVTQFGNMRIEDMVGVFSDGKVVNLTRS